MAISITYDKRSLEELKGRLKKQFEVMANKQPLLGKIAVQMYSSSMRNFQEEGTDKQKWQGLSPFTLWVKRIRKRKRTETPRILQDTGFLRQSIVQEIGEDYAVVGTNLPYAVLHQKGGVSQPSAVEIGSFKRRSKLGKEFTVHPFIMNIRGGHKVPARPFLTIREEHKQRILNLARRWFQAKGV